MYSGWSRAGADEYWGEAVAAFSFKHSRTQLKRIDPDMS
jgi:hypothetical protein